MGADLVSIVIPAYNAANYLAEAIDSALSQTYPHVEIIVVNDGSRDDGATREVALSYGDKIRYFEKENGGSSSAINYGIRQMKGEWFSWLSHDDLYCPQKLQSEMDWLNAHVDSSEERYKHIFFSGCELMDANHRTLRKDSKKNMLAMHREIENVQGNEYLVAQPRRYNFHGCSCLVHKKVFEEVGAFDETLRILNDVEMWFRIYSAGFHLHFIPEILVKGRVHAKQVSHSNGYSANHPENDMLWARRLQWLIENGKNNIDVFELFGKNAYLSARSDFGNQAFAIAKDINPQKAAWLWIKKQQYVLRAGIRKIEKAVYMKITR